MIDAKVRMNFIDGTEHLENLYAYCCRLSKKNNSVLYLLESYLDKKLLDEPELAEIRNILLTVSADITRINNNLYIEFGEDNEEL